MGSGVNEHLRELFHGKPRVFVDEDGFLPEYTVAQIVFFLGRAKGKGVRVQGIRRFLHGRVFR